jgi:gas vesicle protein
MTDWRMTMKRRNEREGVEGQKLGGIGVLIAAATLGAGTALLLAPSSGEEVRRALRRRYRKTMKRLDRSTENLRDRLEELLDQAKEARRSKVRQYLRRREAGRRLHAA